MSAILTLNAGSSSIKFSVYLQAEKCQSINSKNTNNKSKRNLEEIVIGQVENLGPAARIIVKHGDAKTSKDIGVADHKVALTEILKTLTPILGDHKVVGVGHRVVHGGVEFDAPVLLTDEVFDKLSALTPLAPLHQPHNLAAIKAAQSAFPEAMQVACFDTAFHRGHPWVNDVFAIPKRFYDKGVRRYGFHGLSYDYITGHIKQHFPDLDDAKIVIAHLGNGASMCAVKDGKSIGSTMGFSALDGLPMGTRCGQLDPGVVLYLMDQGLSHSEISHVLYKESGLKGLSGISADMRELLASSEPEAKQAIDYYVFRIRREIGGLSAVLGGIDALVFCGGIGENASQIRVQVLEGMDYLGLSLDPEANENNATDIGDGSTLTLVIPTDEERVIARAVAEKLR